MKTQLHKNLFNGLIAITQGGKVVGYCESATMVGCDVREDAKKAAFSRTPGNKRTVHIWVRGTLSSVVGFEPFKGRDVVLSPAFEPLTTRRAHYSPKRQEQGFMVGSEIWTGGKAATVSTTGMWVA